MNNSNLQETYKMAVEILTPVNIADNTALNPKEYLYDAKKGTVYFLNQMTWHKFIYTHNLLNKYEKYMTGYDKRNLYEWLQSCGYTVDDVGSAIKSKSFAHVNVMRKENKRTLNDIIIQTKLADGTPYIPGSSIKGVLRTAILYDLLSKNREIKKKYWDKANNNLSGNKRNVNNEIGNIAIQIENELLHKLKLYDANGKAVKNTNAVCSIMRGISIGDSEYNIQNKVSLEILQKIDLVLTDGRIKDNKLSVFRECILPKAKFNFQLKLDKTMTKEIGINSINDLLVIVQNYFDFVNNILRTAFGRECSSLFSDIDNGNIYLGANTGFLTKTLVMALAPAKNDAVNYIRRLLDINFNSGKNKHNSKKDTKISPRTLKATVYNGKKVLMGVGRIYKDE